MATSYNSIPAALALVALLVCPVSATAQTEAEPPVLDLPLEDLVNLPVTGASRFEQPASHAPSAITVITREDIRGYGYRTLADILNGVRSFSISYDRNYSYIGARGFGTTGDYNSRVLVLINGHRLNEVVYGSVLIGTEFPIDVDLIDRIEIIRGPFSSLYGSSAFFGVINITTRRGQHIDGVEVSADAGSHDAYRGRITAGKRYDSGMNGVVSGTIYDSKGNRTLYFPEYDTPETAHGVARNADSDRSYSLFSSYFYKNVTVEGAFISRTKGIPTGSFGTDFDTARNRTNDSLGYIDLRHEEETPIGTVASRVSYNRYRYSGDYMYDGVLNKDKVLGEWIATETGLTAAWLPRNRISVGGTASFNLHRNQRNYDVSPYASYLDDRRSNVDWGLYLQDEVTILDELLLNVGVRHDYDGTNNTSPRAALIYLPRPATSIKVLYGQAYRAPNVYEKYYHAPSMHGNPDLAPEKITTYELVWEELLTPNLKMTTAAYFYRIRNLITLVSEPNDDLMYRNRGTMHARGFEWELEGKWDSGISGRASYTVQGARNGDSPGEDIENSPKHVVKLNILAPLYRETAFAGIETRYTSRRKTLQGKNLPDFAVVNFTLLAKALLPGLDLSASIYNVFDERDPIPGSVEHRQDVILLDGRTFRIQALWKF